MTRDQLEALPTGSAIHRGNVRADLRTVYKDADVVLVMPFPQDVNHCPGSMWQRWPMADVFPGQ